MPHIWEDIVPFKILLGSPKYQCLLAVLSGNFRWIKVIILANSRGRQCERMFRNILFCSTIHGCASKLSAVKLHNIHNLLLPVDFWQKESGASSFWARHLRSRDVNVNIRQPREEEPHHKGRNVYDSWVETKIASQWPTGEATQPQCKATLRFTVSGYGEGSPVT